MQGEVRSSCVDVFPFVSFVEGYTLLVNACLIGSRVDATKTTECGILGVFRMGMSTDRLNSD